MGQVVLYIDDSGVERRIVRQLLEDEGFRVLTAGKPEEGVELARAEKPDVILLDLHLPGMNGYKVADRLREIPGLESVPIVAISASLKEEERSEIFSKFDGFIQKPVDVDVFPHAIREFTKQKGRGRKSAEEKPASRENDHRKYDVETLELLKTLEKMRATMSHDLRTPLTIMISYASTVEREKVGELNERQKEMLDLVVQHGFQLDAQITSLVQLARETLKRFGYPPGRY